MTGNNPGTFTIDGVSYPVTPQVYRYVQSYLQQQDNIEWVTYEEPYVQFGLVLDNGGGERRIQRRINSLLTESRIGKYVLTQASLKPLTKQPSN